MHYDYDLARLQIADDRRRADADRLARRLRAAADASQPRRRRRSRRWLPKATPRARRA